MKLSDPYALTVRLAAAGLALLACGVAFVFMPDGWNVVPLVFIAIIIAAAGSLFRSVRPVPREADGIAPSGDPPGDAAPVAAVEGASAPNLARRMNRAFGPIVAGVVIDLVDLATFGPIGLVLGLPIGGAAGYWMGTALGLSRRASLWCALAAGVYCTIPFTELIPLATMVGAYVRFRESGKETEAKEANREDLA